METGKERGWKQDAHAGAPLIELTGGAVSFDLQLKKSVDLIDWQNFGDPVQWAVGAGQKRFYRLWLGQP